MKITLKLALAGAFAFGGLAMTQTVAAAAPMVDPGVASAADLGSSVEKARVVCDAWGRCWRTRPRYYAPRYYGGPRFYGHRHYYAPRYRHRPYRHYRRW